MDFYFLLYLDLNQIYYVQILKRMHNLIITFIFLFINCSRILLYLNLLFILIFVFYNQCFMYLIRLFYLHLDLEFLNLISFFLQFCFIKCFIMLFFIFGRILLLVVSFILMIKDHLCSFNLLHLIFLGKF
jgi:hypothetical protein